MSQEKISESLQKAIEEKIQDMDISEMTSKEMSHEATLRIKRENPEAYDLSNPKDALIFKLLED